MDFKSLLKNKWLLLIAAVGMLLLLIGSYFPSRTSTPTISPLSSIGTPSGESPATSLQGQSPSNQSGNPTTNPDQSTSAKAIESDYDQSLQHILSQIQGIHAVTVMVTVDSSGTLTVAKNNSSSETDSGSGSSTTTTTKSQTDQIYTAPSSSGGGPYVLSNTQPNVRGVLVTVNADDFIVAKSEIVESITNVLDVPAYKISVEPQK